MSTSSFPAPRVAAPLTLAAAIFLAACSTPSGSPSHSGDPYIVKPKGTLFYSFGPAQTTGPDFGLPGGTRLTVLSYEFGYSHVAIPATDKTGFVPTEDLAPAPPTPKPAASPTPASRMASRRHSAAVYLPSNVNDTAPLPELPDTKPPPGSPGFRY
jgi:hypothetical protein